MIRTHALRLELLSIFLFSEQQMPEGGRAHLLCGLLESALDLATAFCEAEAGSWASLLFCDFRQVNEHSQPLSRDIQFRGLF